MKKSAHNLSQYTLDPSSKIPLYFQLEEILRRLIKQGEFVPGELLPSEAELQKIFSVSRITVRQSLGNLERDGLIVRRRAKGTRVAEPRIEGDLQQIRSFDNDIRAQGYEPVTLHYQISMAPCEEPVAKALGCRPGDQVYHLLRLRGVPDRPVGWFETHLPARLNLDLAGDYSGSLYHLLETRYHVAVVVVDESLEATAASPEIAHKLGLDAGDPVLKQVRTGYDQNRQPLEYTVVHFRGDIYRYRYRHQR